MPPRKKKVRDIADLARELHHAWIVACAAVPFPPELVQYDGTLIGGDEDPRYVVLVNARHAAFERAQSELINNPDYAVEPWMITALQAGIIPASSDGAVPGSQVIAPEGMSHRD